MKNQSLMEQPAHKHYSACHARMLQIKSLSLRILIYSFLSGIYLFVKAMTAHRLPFLTFMSKLANDSFVGTHLIDIAVILALFVLAILGFMKNYLCDVIIFFVYLLMTVCGLFSVHGVTDFFILLTSAVGAVLSFKSIDAYSDYKQLYETEGFPLFNEHLGNYDDHPEYVPTKEVYKGASSEMSDITSVPELKSTSPQGYMDDLPIVNTAKPEAEKSEFLDFTEVSGINSDSSNNIDLRE